MRTYCLEKRTGIGLWGILSNPIQKIWSLWGYPEVVKVLLNIIDFIDEKEGGGYDLVAVGRRGSGYCDKAAVGSRGPT